MSYSLLWDLQLEKQWPSALSDMVRSLNHLLQQSITAQALVWRFKAWRAGIPYPQYVILQTLIYRVEQIFFIHKETGLLLESASAAGIEYQDPDLVSSMLTAINDFVSDSFEQDEGSLSTIQYGELNLIIESGPSAVIAMAIRGTVPPEIKNDSQELLEKLHQKFFNQLESFNGDISQFSDSKKLLANALIEKKKVKEKKKPWLAIVALTMTASIFGYFAFYSYQQTTYINQFIDTLSKVEGYQLIDSHLNENQLFVELLRSPTAPVISQYQSEFNYPGIELKINAKPVLFDDPALFLPILEQRHQIKLESEIRSGEATLIPVGKAYQENLDALSNDPVRISLYPAFDKTQVVIITRPSAVEKARQEFKAILARVKSVHILFDVASTSISGESHERLAQMSEDIKILLALQPEANFQVLQINITGFADNNGPRQKNIDLSEDRAELIANSLVANGIDKSLIVNWGVGTIDSNRLPSDMQRRVSVDLLYQEASEQAL